METVNGLLTGTTDDAKSVPNHPRLERGPVEEKGSGILIHYRLECVRTDATLKGLHFLPLAPELVGNASTAKEHPVPSDFLNGSLNESKGSARRF